MKIAGQSFAVLTQLTKDSQTRAAGSAEDAANRRAALRAERIETARAARQQDVDRFGAKSFKSELGAKHGKAAPQPHDKPSNREALGARQGPPPQPGQVVNIVI